MLSWMGYAALVALLLGGAAWALERAALSHGAPTRWVWTGALGGAALPLVELFQPPVPAPATAAPREGTAPPLLGATFDRIVTPPALPPDLDPFAAAGWGFLSLTAAVLLLFALLRLRRARSGWTPIVVDGREVLLAEEAGPAVVGLFRTAVVVPRWVVSLPVRERRLVLAHEEEHRRAGDVPLLATATFLLVALPWNLPLWWIVRRLRLAVEVDCDRRVLADASDPRRYANLLLDMGRRGFMARIGALALARPAPHLERRIRIMTDPIRPRPGLTLLLSAAGVALLLGACRVDRPVGPEPTNEAFQPVSADHQAEELPPFSLHVRPTRSESGAFVLTGMVQYRGEDRPVEAAQVVLEGVQIGALTNRQGRFLLLNVPGGEHDILVSRGGEGPYRLGRVELGESSGVESLAQPSPAPAPEGRGGATGVLVDASGHPLPAVQITVPSLERGGLTNAQGRFLILGLPQGTHTLVYQHAELGRGEVKIEVQPGETATAGTLTLGRR